MSEGAIRSSRSTWSASSKRRRPATVAAPLRAATIPFPLVRRGARQSQTTPRAGMEEAAAELSAEELAAFDEGRTGREEARAAGQVVTVRR